MRILDDGPADAGAHTFTVELDTRDEPDAEQVQELWESAPDTGTYGGPHAIVRAEGGKVDTAVLWPVLERFNQAPDDGWRWTVDALAAYLLHELCGVALLDFRQPPNPAPRPPGKA